MLFIVDEILSVDESKCIYLSFNSNEIEIKMSKILQAIADGKNVSKVLIKVSGVHPTANFFVMCLIDGNPDGEFAGESLVDEIISKVSGVDQSEYQPYKIDKNMRIMREKANMPKKDNSTDSDQAFNDKNDSLN